jgi:hypothetical protein
MQIKLGTSCGLEDAINYATFQIDLEGFCSARGRKWAFALRYSYHL